MFKIGDKVVCIDDNKSHGLNIDKIYLVTEIDGLFIMIDDDYNNYLGIGTITINNNSSIALARKYYHHISRFISIKESRKKKINKIL